MAYNNQGAAEKLIVLEFLSVTKTGGYFHPLLRPDNCYRDVIGLLVSRDILP